VRIETGAGTGAKFSDTAYSENGGQITYDRQKVWESDIIIKVGPPTLEEISMMKIGQTLISGLQVATLKPEYLKALKAHPVPTGFAYESGSNPDFLSVAQIRSLIKMHMNPEFEPV
jgi:alanine dehydrogenase